MRNRKITNSYVVDTEIRKYNVPSGLTAKSKVSASVLEEEMSSLTPMASAADNKGRNCSL